MLRDAIDFAGLFPPAALSMRDAVDRYADYRRSPDGWALGRFVVPAARLAELVAALDALDRGLAGDSWPISVTLGTDRGRDLDLLAQELDRARALGIRARAVEARVTARAELPELLDRVPPGVALYGELPLGAGRDEVLEALAAAGAAAKIRMGGTTADAFPAAAAVASVLVEALALRTPFKATAGLHHPLRGEFRLTYETGSPAAPMFGYLNLALAAAIATDGELDLVLAALLESDPAAITMDDAGLSWRGRLISTAALHRLRASYHGFGSCSFREPMDELRPFLRV